MYARYVPGNTLVFVALSVVRYLVPGIMHARHALYAFVVFKVYKVEYLGWVGVLVFTAPTADLYVGGIPVIYDTRYIPLGYEVPGT